MHELQLVSSHLLSQSTILGSSAEVEPRTVTTDFH